MRRTGHLRLLLVCAAVLSTVLLQPAGAAPPSGAPPSGASSPPPSGQSAGLGQTADRAVPRALARLLRRAGVPLSDLPSQDDRRTDRMLLRLTGGARDRGVEVVQRRSARGQAARPRSAQTGHDELLVVAVDDVGAGLSAALVADPGEVRVEWPSTSGVLTGRTATRPAAQVAVDLPADPRITSLRVYAPTDDGSLRLVDETPVPGREAPASRDAPPPPRAVSSLLDNGPSHNRIDLVVLGDGYTADQLGQYAEDARAFVTGLLAQRPFADYRSYFNVRRVDVASSQSGADHPSRSPSHFVDTAFGATYDCAGIERLICADPALVEQAIADLPSTERDVVLLLVNDAQFGGSGGAIAVSSLHPDGTEIVLHELGHSFGLLADEYAGGGPSCVTGEPSGVNVTRQLDRAVLKWRSWVDPATPLPTLEPGVVGAYEGAAYCDDGVYRPTYDSKMRTLGRPFESVNTEQLVRRMYAFVRPVDAVEPAVADLPRQQGRTELFRVAVPTPVTHPLSISWSVDGETVGTGTTHAVVHDDLGPGQHVVTVTVSDPTPLARATAELTTSATWTIGATPCPDAAMEPDDVAAQARPVAPGSETHAVCRSGDEDWVRFDAVRGLTYSVQTLEHSPGLDLDLAVFDSDGSSLLATGDGTAGIRLREARGGDRYVRVSERARGEGLPTYVLRLTAAPSVPASRQDCLHGGWRDLVDGAGQPFRNQGACIAWVLRRER